MKILYLRQREFGGPSTGHIVNITASAAEIQADENIREAKQTSTDTVTVQKIKGTKRIPEPSVFFESSI